MINIVDIATNLLREDESASPVDGTFVCKVTLYNPMDAFYTLVAFSKFSTNCLQDSQDEATEVPWSLKAPPPPYTFENIFCSVFRHQPEQ